MFGDEFARINPAASVGSITGPDKGRDELTHLEMQMGEVCAVGRADGRDLLASPHIVTRPNEHRFDMPVIGLNVFTNAVFFIGVQHNDNIPPSFAAIASEQDAPIGNGKDGIAEVAVLAADAIKIIAEMAILGESLRVVGKGAVLVSERKIKARRGGQRNEFE